MIRFGGSPYASQMPQIVVTAVQTITAYRTAAAGAAASIMMMTSVRIVSPIIETPSRMPDAKATTAVTEMTVGRIMPRLRRSRKNVDAFEQSRLGDDRHEERQAEDEQHRVGVDQVVEAVERQQVAAAPRHHPPRGNLGMPAPRWPVRQNVATMIEQHPVGEGVLVDLVPERAEQEEAENGDEHLHREQPERKCRDTTGQQAPPAPARSQQETRARQHHDGGRRLRRGDVAQVSLLGGQRGRDPVADGRGRLVARSSRARN